MDGESAVSAQARLVAALAARLAREQPVQHLETHISHVLLTPQFAYKIKKPVRLPFVDYSTAAARRHFCEEELRLNARLAPTLYLGVSRITGPADAPALDGDGETLDHAVRMRRFADGALWSERLAAGTLRPVHVDHLAARLAAFHIGAARAPAGSPFGSATERRRAALEACASLTGQVDEAARAALEAWFEHRAGVLAPLWEERRAAGCVRECHGDLHLHNLLVDGDESLAFDGIEFNDRLRWIDVVDDIGFAAMDLMAHGRRDWAFRLLDGWLEATGDHAGVPALAFALAYRATVRAEVAALQRQDTLRERYFALACELAARQDARLLATHGLPGSGKSWCAARLLEAAGALRVRSDVERKRLAGLAAQADSRAQGLDLYGAELTERTYAALLARAAPALAAGWPVILDAAYLRRAQRDAAADFAAAAGVPFALLDCRAPMALLRERVAARRGDASEADLAVLEHLARVQEPLGADEQRCALVVDTAAPFDAAALAAHWQAAAATRP